MLVVHANWSRDALHLWAESPDAFAAQHKGSDFPAASPQVAAMGSRASQGDSLSAIAAGGGSQPHPFAADHATLLTAIDDMRTGTASSGDQHASSSEGPAADMPRSSPSSLALRLPAEDRGPLPSDHLRFQLTEIGANDRDDDVPTPRLGAFEVPSLALSASEAVKFLLNLPHAAHREVNLAPSVKFFAQVAQLAIDVLESQRFVPTLFQSRDGELQAAWRPWLQDGPTREALSSLLQAMPPVVRAHVDESNSQPWPILHGAFTGFCDGFVRNILVRESFADALDGRNGAADAQVAWLGGLLAHNDRVSASPNMGANLLTAVGEWVRRLDEAAQPRPMRLLLRLSEPEVEGSPDDLARAKPGEETWTLSFHLQSMESPSHVLDARAIWAGLAAEGHLEARAVEHPEELLLSELGRVSRLWPRLESVLSQRAPTHIDLTTLEAYEFLRDLRPLLEDSGVHVESPAWWNQPLGRLGARLQIESPASATLSANGQPASSMLGLNAIVQYRWQIAIGDQPLTVEEFEALARSESPLVRVRGRWIEIHPEQLAEARQFMFNSPAGEMTLLEAIQAAHGASGTIGRELPVFGLDARGWVADVLSASSDDRAMPLLEQPASFLGSLRPYQKTGVSWLAFLDHYGLGACLADDMGLGKTIEFIAMLLHEREARSDQRPALSGQSEGDGKAKLTLEGAPTPLSPALAPTLLIVPTSVVANWVRELERFAPSLKPWVHHGPERLEAERFVEVALQHDLVITTYPLVARDHDTLRRVNWHRLTLDEAQYIKNPPTKQTSAIRSLPAARRLALTGTPVENRLSELWSIMEFLNPGYLGPAADFRRRFAVPIERHRNSRQAERLRQMVRPFVLRRVKTDPKVIDDLPPCVETKEYAVLTAEQAQLYERVVQQMLGEVDRASGIQRRGLVLATLVRLKQICNHPAQYLNSIGAPDSGDVPAASPDEAKLVATAIELQHDQLPSGVAIPPGADANLSARSGKSQRLLTMLEEVMASGERALLFTQFRQMGHLLASMLQSELGIEPLFLHGGTPAAKRQHLIDRFQSAQGGSPVFILSLKAGGLGLNLTAASHVFHFDRWWNPAVENQATDRAFRIGQTRRVHVHKFVCVGTLEERIDQMIEQKTELAQNIIGAGESWLTELSTSQLRDLLTLRTSAMEVET